MAITISGSGITSANIADGTIVNADINSSVELGVTDAEKVNLKSGRKNLIINGGFDVWQRGTSQSTSAMDSDDRWTNRNTGSTKVASQQTFTLGQTGVPNNPTYYSRTVVTSVAGANNYVLKEYRVEGVNSFSGTTVTLSFYAKADATKNMAVQFEQNFGTGGSPSTTVDSIGVNTINLTSSWQRFDVQVTVPSITGKTLGTDNNDYVRLVLWFDAGSDKDARSNSLGQQSGTFDLAQVQLELGSVATDFEHRSYGEELALCQRYYEVIYGSIRAANAGGYVGSSATCLVAKRVTPTITYLANGAVHSNLTQSGIYQQNTSGCAVQFAGTHTSLYAYGFSLSAEAEL